jgi:hypothetical protein
MGGISPVNKPLLTMIVDIGILAVLVAISLGIWFYPWITVAVLAVAVCVGCFTTRHT